MVLSALPKDKFIEMQKPIAMQSAFAFFLKTFVVFHKTILLFSKLTFVVFHKTIFF